MKRIFYLFIAITIFGCSKDEEVLINPGPKLIKTIETNLITNQNQTTEYTYLGDLLKTVTTTEYNGTINKRELIYVNNKIESIEYERLSLKNTQTFKYQDDLISEIISNEDNKNTILYYSYNSGILKSKEQFTDGRFVAKSSYEFKNNETTGYNAVIETIYDSKNNITEQLTHESDNKISPYYNTFLGAYSKIQPLFPKNIIKKTSKSGIITSYNYKYNNNDYPNEMTEVNSGLTRFKTIFIY